MTHIFERYEIANDETVQSLVKAEWETVRAHQRPLSSSWPLINRRFSKECCGIIFTRRDALASNGHWMMKIRTKGEMIDPNVQSLFFTYCDTWDDVTENFNPFDKYFGVSLDDMYDVFNVWHPYNVKIRIDDFMNAVNNVVPTVRDRRGYALHLSYKDGMLGLRFGTKESMSEVCVIPAHGYNVPNFPDFSVNLSYVTKILGILAEWYYVVDIAYSGCFDDYIIIKAKNPHGNKPDLRFALGQFSYLESK